MIDLRKIFNQRTLILAMAIVIFLLLFFRGGKDPVAPVIDKPTKEVVKEVKRVSIVYRDIDSGYKKKFLEKSKEVGGLKSRLSSAEGMVNELLNDAGQSIDTGTRAELHAQLDLMKQAVAIKDSLCNQAIAGQDSLISIQAEQMVVKDEFNARLRESFNQVVSNEQAKDKYISQLKKQVRKKKFGNVVWKLAAGAAGAVILNGALK